jgi:hypothetical protein
MAKSLIKRYYNHRLYVEDDLLYGGAIEFQITSEGDPLYKDRVIEIAIKNFNSEVEIDYISIIYVDEDTGEDCPADSGLSDDECIDRINRSIPEGFPLILEISKLIFENQNLSHKQVVHNYIESHKEDYINGVKEFKE